MSAAGTARPRKGAGKVLGAMGAAPGPSISAPAPMDGFSTAVPGASYKRGGHIGYKYGAKHGVNFNEMKGYGSVNGHYDRHMSDGYGSDHGFKASEFGAGSLSRKGNKHA